MAGSVAALPAATNAFVGRSREIAGLDGALRLARLVTVTGPGGVGKTRLALELARRRARRSSPVVLVDLSGIGEERLVPAAFAAAVDPGGTATGELPAAARVLSGRPRLLVVDNCEHVADAAAAAVTALLGAFPALRILATSREALRVPGEAVWALAPLDRDDAFRLFVTRAEAVRPGAAAGAEGTIDELCRRLEGLPLALELAAARVSVLSPRTILDHVGDRLDVLSADVRGVPRRHRSVRATIEWSFDLLRRDEQDAFARLSVFPASFSLDASGAVARVDLDALGGLVAKSLVAVEPVGGEVRYRMLDALQAYARERLGDGGDAQALRARHLDYFLARAEAVHASDALGGSDAEVAALSVELDNLRAALAWAVEHDRGRGLRLIGASRQAWYRRSQSEGRDWATRLLAGYERPDLARALALLCAGQLAVAHQDHAAARGLLSDAAELAERLENAGVLAAVLHYRGLSGMLARDLDPAERDLGRSVDLFRRLDQRQGVGRGLGILGLVLLYRGDPDGARRVLEEGLSAARDGDDAWGQGQVGLALGLTAKATGDADAALEHLRAAVRALRRASDRTILGVALGTIAGLAVADDPRRALRLAAAAVAARQSIGGSYPAGTLTELERVRRAGTEALGHEAESEWRAGLRLDDDAIAALVEDRSPAPARGPLTVRQLEVARLVADGLTNAQVGARLHLSERTVENHVFNALTALGLHNRVQLATWVTEQDGRRRA